jgi:hypothetical protein
VNNTCGIRVIKIKNPGSYSRILRRQLDAIEGPSSMKWARFSRSENKKADEFLAQLRSGPQLYKLNPNGQPGKRILNRMFPALAEWNELVMSATGKIATFATSCMSYILYSEKAKAGVAAHVYYEHAYDRLLHLNTLSFALGALKVISRGGTIKAFISGGKIGYPFTLASDPTAVSTQYRARVVDAVFFLHKCGVIVDTIDLGSWHKVQLLDLKSGKFRSIRDNTYYNG